MNKSKLQEILDEYYEIPEHKRNENMIELLEALLEEDYDPNIGKTNFSE